MNIWMPWNSVKTSCAARIASRFSESFTETMTVASGMRASSGCAVDEDEEADDHDDGEPLGGSRTIKFGLAEIAAEHGAAGHDQVHARRQAAFFLQPRDIALDLLDERPVALRQEFGVELHCDEESPCRPCFPAARRYPVHWGCGCVRGWRPSSRPGRPARRRRDRCRRWVRARPPGHLRTRRFCAAPVRGRRR